MSFTQLSQHLFIAGNEDPTQCFQRYGQPLSQLCYALVETGPDGVQFVRWSKIQELYNREGKVKFVVDGNDHVPLAIGPDMQIIVPWRIQAFLDKTLQVALNDEQPGFLDSKSPADIHPIVTTDANAESDPSSNSSSVFMTLDTKLYTATSSSSSLALPPPVVTAAMSRRTTAVFPDDAGPSPSTCPAMAATDEASFFSPHTHFEVAQDDERTVPLLPPPTCPQKLTQGKADHALGESYHSPSRPSLPPPCCPRYRQQTRVNGPKEESTQVFTPSNPTPVPWLHEPILPVICMDCSLSFQDAPIYSAAKTKRVVDDNSDRDSTIDHDSSSSSNPVLSSIAVSSHRRAFTYPVTSGFEARVNHLLLSASQIAKDSARPSFPQPASSRSASMQAPSTHRQKSTERSTLFLGDELQPFFD